MSKAYHVSLSAEQRDTCEKLLRAKTATPRQRPHARILLLADRQTPAGSQADGAIGATARTSVATVARVRRRFVEAGLEAALFHRPQANRKEPTLDGAGEAHLIAMVCSAPPAGHQRWTLHLLKDRLIEHGYTNMISHENVRRRLKKTNLSLG
jgi:hypothetical protein